MPELPEAETIVRGLRSILPGLSMGAPRILHADVLEDSTVRFRNGITGRTIQGVERRGKNIVLLLGTGNADPSFPPDLCLVVNLGMSGRLLHRSSDDPSPPPSHPAIIIPLAPPRGPEGPTESRPKGGGAGGGPGAEGAGSPEPSIVYHDTRRFGRLRLLTPEEFRSWSRSLGPEPLSRNFTARRLQAGLDRSVSPVRSWLLDQRRVAGVGNIYANEALFLARVHPATPASAIPAERVSPLHRALRKVLREAVEARGTTLRDYRTAQGSEGSYGGALRVYGQDGEPCPRCRTPIRRIVFGNRSAFLCPSCQPPPDA